MVLTRSGLRLEEAMMKAIKDQVIKNSEYEELVELVHEDGVVDAHERVLLKELNNLIAEKAVKRLPG